jgi:propanediol dehydratase small subunit
MNPNVQLAETLTQQSIGQTIQALRQQRSIVRTSFQNNMVSNQDRDYNQRLVQQLSKMTLSIYKIQYLKKKEELLTSMRNLYQLADLNGAVLDRNWRNNHLQLQREKEQYHHYFTELQTFY